MKDAQALTDEVREIVESIHGRPRGRRGVTVVISNLLCSEGGPCWVAKVKYGSAVIAKCGPVPCGHLSIESALEGLEIETRRVLGVTG